jgi:hypothetical protein
MSALTVPPATVTGRVSRSRTTVTGLSLIAAPVLLIAGNLLSTSGDSNSPAFLAKVAASSGHEQASIVCFLLGFALLIPGAYGLLDTIRGRGETIATIGALLTTIGAAAFAGLECSGIANIGVARSVPAAQAARIVTEMGNVGAAGAVFLLGLALPVGMILVTIGIRRARRAPLWVPIVTALGFLIVMFVESTLGGVAGDVLMLAALGYLGVRRLDGDADSA